MLKYEEKLHFEKYYNKLQSNSFLHKAISLVWGIAGYVLLYYLIKYFLSCIMDFQPWNDFETWFVMGGVRFIKADLVYFTYGLIIICYGTIKLSKITVQNHSAKMERAERRKNYWLMDTMPKCGIPCMEHLSYCRLVLCFRSDLSWE